MGKTALIFAGQGSQYEKQGAGLYEKYPEVRDIYDLLGEDLKRISFEGDLEEISKTQNLQPIMIAFQLSVLRLLRNKLPAIDAGCGLSLGEYSAIALAGIVSENEALDLVRKRGELMGEASGLIESKMLALLKVTEEEARELLAQRPDLDGKVYIANINSSRQIVVSGEASGIDELEKFAKEQGKIAKPLVVSGAFHTPFMEPARVKFAEYLKGVTFKEPVLDYYPNLTGEKYSGQDMKEVLPDQIVSPVLLYKTFKNMVEDGVDHFVEIGPGGVLSNILKREFSDIRIDTIKDDEDLIKYLGGE
ncbi:MAG: ACP S-malonyltransferase [Clostridiales bacterium]|nr:ACP S-malonyltransferase [Clostridiales bacterium]MDU1042401.1 ACP S-malonyltransferase [Clostridiales bacterium]MDU3490588.1 ACP S-malonyltransferase [Clostridiales bacterium]